MEIGAYEFTDYILDKLKEDSATPIISVIDETNGDGIFFNSIDEAMTVANKLREMYAKRHHPHKIKIQRISFETLRRIE